MENNALVAIPAGLLDFTTTLTYMYGRPRIIMAAHADPAEAQRSPAILGNRHAGRFV